MRITLSAYEAAVWQRGHWEAYAIELDCLEDIERQNITEPVAFLLPDTNTVAFALTPAPGWRAGR